MSNARQAEETAAPAGDMGIGLCMMCLGQFQQEVQACKLAREQNLPAVPPRQPRFAITFAPSSQPARAPDGEVIGIGVVALPTCYQHLMRGDAKGDTRRRAPGVPVAMPNGAPSRPR